MLGMCVFKLGILTNHHNKIEMSSYMRKEKCCPAPPLLLLLCQGLDSETLWSEDLWSKTLVILIRPSKKAVRKTGAP